MFSHGNNFESKLITSLLSETVYNKYARPVKNAAETLEIKFEILLQQIIDVVCAYYDIRSHLFISNKTIQPVKLFAQYIQ